MGTYLVPTDITILPKGQEAIRIAAKEVLTFDLRLGGFTLAEMLDHTRPLPAPREIHLTVNYTDGTVKQWHLERATQHQGRPEDVVDGHAKLTIRADRVQEVTG